jgi:LacI family transcriptional regulator
VKVSPETLKKVKSAMDELGYRPNTIAQSLASNRTNRVGILVSELSGPFFSNMLSVVEQELRNAGMHAVIAAGHSDENSEKEGIDFLLSCRCDGLILHIDSVSDDYLLELYKQGIPFSIINHRIEELSDRCFTVDNIMGGYLATKSLLKRGHRKIAYISGPSFKEDALLRLAGHKQALTEYDIEFDESLHCNGNYQEEGGKQALRSIYKRNHDFTAVVCANDEMAVGAMYSARDLGFSLPETLSIVGFDDLIFARYTYPTLSTVHNPISDMGSMAVKWILREVYKHKISEELINVFVPEFIIRRSINTI